MDSFFVLTYSLGKRAKIWNTPNEVLVEVKLVCGLRRFITEVIRCLCVCLPFHSMNNMDLGGNYALSVLVKKSNNKMFPNGFCFAFISIYFSCVRV